jgi:hypothetical protein
LIAISTIVSKTAQRYNTEISAPHEATHEATQEKGESRVLRTVSLEGQLTEKKKKVSSKSQTNTGDTLTTLFRYEILRDIDSSFVDRMLVESNSNQMLMDCLRRNRSIK